MKEFLSVLALLAAFVLGVVANELGRDNHLTCAQAVLHNNVAKCAVYIDKDVMR